MWQALRQCGSLVMLPFLADVGVLGLVDVAL